MSETAEDKCAPLSSPEMGAVAHLYRGEIYRSTIWRTRLDATTNWSVVSLGIALTISYSSPEASALPLILVALLIAVFLYLEARRYRYFNVWRARARWLEIHFYAPLLRREEYHTADWMNTLAADYDRPEHHIAFRTAIGRRLRRNYVWIYGVQGLALIGKVVGHPYPAESINDIFDRMAFGGIPGSIVTLFCAAAYGGLVLFTAYVYWTDKKRFKTRRNPISMG